MNIAKHSESTGLQGEKISRFQVEDSHVFIDLIEIEEGEFDLVVTLNNGSPSIDFRGVKIHKGGKK